VSTQDKHLTGQLEQLKAAGATTIFKEKISGARADRPQLAKLMAALQPGDVVVVTKLDRLGRSTGELLDLIERIGKAGAAFRSLGDPIWDTSSSQGRLLSTLLAAIAEFERDLIRERTGEGRKRARAKGVKFGRIHDRCYPSEPLHGRATDLARGPDRDCAAETHAHGPHRGDRPRFRGDCRGRGPRTDAAARAALKRRAAGETLAEIAKRYAIDMSMTSRLR